MTDLLAFFRNGGLSLDSPNQKEVTTLLQGAFWKYLGTARDAISEILKPLPADAEESG
ncbi:hypothetical protein ACFQY0_20265 [Haloferula chungangensis]|uniref:Uncharacterized protein n=1 Tax=Haloferula chungangensis TaxID=1048331 RepID=A0ABW2LAT3_9BACT